jgi:hypothetical protein
MKATSAHPTKVRLKFPLWQYLIQPVFHPSVSLHINPVTFWQQYRIEHLHRCWLRDCTPEENPFP